MAYGDAWAGKRRGNWRMEWVASTLLATSEHGVSSITIADAHTLAASSGRNWRLRRFEWPRPFRRKTKSGFCACAITFQLASNIINPSVAGCLPHWPVQHRKYTWNKGNVLVNVMDVQRHFLTMPLNGREWVALRPGYVPVRKESPVPTESKESRFVPSVQQKSSGVKFSKSRTGSHVTYSCHNSSRFIFPIFVHSWRSSVFHSLQSITPRIY
jgi:hypothetical protein